MDSIISIIGHITVLVIRGSFWRDGLEQDKEDFTTVNTMHCHRELIARLGSWNTCMCLEMFICASLSALCVENICKSISEKPFEFQKIVASSHKPFIVTSWEARWGVYETPPSWSCYISCCHLYLNMNYSMSVMFTFSQIQENYHCEIHM